MSDRFAVVQLFSGHPNWVKRTIPFSTDQSKISFWKICQSVLSRVRCNIPNPRNWRARSFASFTSESTRCVVRRRTWLGSFALSALCCAWNAPVICSRNLIVFVPFIWFSQVFAYGPVTVFSNAWLSSKRLSDFWKGRIHTDRPVPRNGSHHETR